MQDGVPYAIDFMNPVPEADMQSIGAESFEWLVEAMANLAIKKARAITPTAATTTETLLKGEPARPRRPRAKKSPPRKMAAVSETVAPTAD